MSSAGHIDQARGIFGPKPLGSRVAPIFKSRSHSRPGNHSKDWRVVKRGHIRYEAMPERPQGHLYASSEGTAGPRVPGVLLSMREGKEDLHIPYLAIHRIEASHDVVAGGIVLAVII